MSSWIKCPCGELLHKNLFCGAGVSVVVIDTVLDSIPEKAPARAALDKIVLEGDTLVRCRKCHRVAVEDKKSGAITIYVAEVSP